MRDSIWNKRIPTLLGLFMIIVGIVATTVLVKTGVITIQNASISEAPQNVRITNISNNSFTVSYTTQTKLLGSLSYGTTSNFGSVGFDDRDQRTTTPSEYNIHYITVKNLQPSTLYFFSITSGKDTYLHNDAPFQVTTGPSLSSDPPTQQPALGKVLLPDGNPPKEAIMYLGASGTETVSALLQPDGSYILPLNSLRTENMSAYAALKSDEKLNGLVVSDSQKSNISVLASQINPIPVITLSQDYEFTTQNTPLASSSAQTKFPSLTTSLSTKSPAAQILTPKNDQGFTDTKPQFKGTAQPGEDVQITVHSEQVINTTITADKTGNWVYRPPTDLAPGEHMITIMTRNAAGILQTIQKSFTVYAAGSQVAQSATPSATLAPTPKTVIPSPTPTTPVPTLAPTEIPTPTTPEVLPTPTVIIPVPPTKGGQTMTPGSEETYLLGFAAIATTSLGVLLFFLSKRNFV